MYCYICPDCGAYLDPGEVCDCKEERADIDEEIRKKEKEYLDLLQMDMSGQFCIVM